jgi:CDP-glucose 4,6-dehydratase
MLRHPKATRPWQHVLDCLCGYLLYAEQLSLVSADTPRALNFGPSEAAPLMVIEVAEAMMAALDAPGGIDIQEQEHSVEASLLCLDSTLAHRTLGWRNLIAGHGALEATAKWYRRWLQGEDMRAAALAEIDYYQAGKWAD